MTQPVDSPTPLLRMADSSVETPKAGSSAERTKYEGNVCIIKDCCRGDPGAVESVSYEDTVVVKGNIGVTIHPNLCRPIHCNTFDHHANIAHDTDIVVATEVGAVRMGFMFQYSTEGQVFVSTDLDWVRKHDKEVLRVFLDMDQQCCVVYTPGEDVDLHYHGTRIVSCNFVPLTEGCVTETAVGRPGCEVIKYNGDGLPRIEVEGDMFVEYNILHGTLGTRKEKKWYSVKREGAAEWFQPPTGVKIMKDERVAPAVGDFTVSRNGVSVLITEAGDVSCSGPGWVFVGKNTGTEEYRINNLVVID